MLKPQLACLVIRELDVDMSLSWQPPGPGWVKKTLAPWARNSIVLVETRRDSPRISLAEERQIAAPYTVDSRSDYWIYAKFLGLLL